MTNRQIIALLSLVTIATVFVADLKTNSLLKNQLVDNLITQYGSQETNVGRQTAQIFESEIKNIETELYTIAAMSEISGGTPEQCKQKLAEVYPLLKSQVGNIGRMGADGIFNCSINAKLVGVSGPKLGSYLTDILNDPLHRPVISRLITPPGANSYVIGIHVPIFDANHVFKGTIGGGIYLNQLQEKYLKRVTVLDDKGYIALSDDNGDIMYIPQASLIGKNRHSDEIQTIINHDAVLNKGFEEAALGKPGVFHNTFNGDPRVSVYYPVSITPSRHWVVTVTVPVSAIRATVLNSGIQKWFTLLYILNILLLIIPILLLLWFLDRRFFSPLQKFITSAVRIGHGDLTAKISYMGDGELGKLAEAFNGMSDELTSSYSLLEAKVKERTAQLEDASKQLAKKVSERTLQLKEVEEVKERIEQEKIRSEAVLQSMGEGLLAVDPTGIVTGLNRAGQHILGISQAEAIGKPISLLFPLTDESGNLYGQEEQQIFYHLQKPMPVRTVSGWTMDKDGNRFPVSIVSSAITDQSEVVGGIAVFRDITKEQQVDRAKTEFVSLASHQLRTPLSSINWYTEMLLAGDAGKVNPDQKSFLGQIYASSQRMVELVNSLLNVSRLELGTFSVDPVSTNILEVANSVLGELKPQLSERKLKLETEFEPTITNLVLDEKLVRMVLQNILSNAVKYTQPGGKIQVAITEEKAGGHLAKPHILICITDNGYGIPTNQQGQIFSKLFRADNVTDKDTEGTGLGLYITKSVMEQTGGSISFTSKEGKGTSFFIAIPKSGMHKRGGNKGLS